MRSSHVRGSDRYATDRVTLRWLLLVASALALLSLVAQGVYLSNQAKFPTDFIGQ